MSTTPEANRTTHTPCPWHVGPHYKSDIESRGGRVAECLPLFTPRAIANAEFIVRACNSHDDLVAACRRMLLLLTNTSGFDQGASPKWMLSRAEAVALADVAIAKAEGK